MVSMVLAKRRKQNTRTIDHYSCKVRQLWSQRLWTYVHVPSLSRLGADVRFNYRGQTSYMDQSPPSYCVRLQEA
jgi:hypothetical protein